jgi:hypothetical protein
LSFLILAGINNSRNKELEEYYYLASSRAKANDASLVIKAFPKPWEKSGLNRARNPSRDILDAFAYNIMGKFTHQSKKLMESLTCEVGAFDENLEIRKKDLNGMITQLFALTNVDNGVVLAIVAEMKKDISFAEPSKTVAVAMLKVVRDRLIRLKKPMPKAVGVDNCQIFAAWITLGLL